MLKRKHTKASEWIPVIEEWKTSGLNKKTFCEQRNINYKSFYRWYTQLTRSTLTCAGSTPLQKLQQRHDFIPVEMSDSVKANNLYDKFCVLRLNAKLQLQIPMTAIQVEFLRTLFEAAEVKSC